MTIEVGDVVQLFITTHADSRQDWVIDGTVLHVPQATGDAWHIRPHNKPEEIVYVQQYVLMRLIHKRGAG
jgi:hypothetical protein